MLRKSVQTIWTASRHAEVAPGAGVPFRTFPATGWPFFSWPRYSVSSWFSAISSTVLVSCFSSPSGRSATGPAPGPAAPAPPPPSARPSAPAWVFRHLL